MEVPDYYNTMVTEWYLHYTYNNSMAAYISIKRGTTTVLFLLMPLQRKDCIENRLLMIGFG